MIDSNFNKRVHAKVAGRYPCAIRLVTASKAVLWTATLESATVDLTTLPVDIDPDVKRIDLPVSIELIIDGKCELLA